MAVASVVPHRTADRPVSITLSQFIRFESAAGSHRIRVVEDIRTQGEWDKLKDFNLALRQRIRAYWGSTGVDTTCDIPLAASVPRQ